MNEKYHFLAYFHFILFHRSPAATADIFRSIVLNREEVDVQKAVSIGGVGDNSNSSKEFDFHEEEEINYKYTYNQ